MIYAKFNFEAIKDNWKNEISSNNFHPEKTEMQKGELTK